MVAMRAPIPGRCIARRLRQREDRGQFLAHLRRIDEGRIGAGIFQSEPELCRSEKIALFCHNAPTLLAATAPLMHHQDMVANS